MAELLFSVVVPSYKPGQYIFDCLDSLAKQTLPSSYFEVIVILNGEQQPYFDQLNRYITNKTNVSLLYSEKASVSVARNIGINEARGSHILFLDDDDFVSAGLLETMSSALEKEEGALIVANFMRYYEDGGIKEDYMSKTYRDLLNYRGRLKWMKFRKFMSSACGKAIPISVIGSNRFDEGMRISEDALFMFQISKNIKSISLCPIDVSYFRRVRESSASRGKRNIQGQLAVLCKSLLNFSRVYFSAPLSYSFVFYVNRLMAVIKHFLLQLR